MSFSVSYIMALHNAKNMLTMFLIGIATVSLFFVIEFRTIVFVVSYIVLIYFLALVFPALPVQQKIINSMAAIILGVTLLVFSRYSYYFKSKHFVKIKELEEKNQQISHLNGQKGEILAFVAHDLRSPLNNIEALGNLMLIENEGNNEAKMIVNAASQAKNIINDLIEAAKQEHPIFSKEPISLNRFVNDLAAKWQTNTDRKIRFYADKEDIVINANPSKLERVIDNLIGNAFKFSSICKPVDITITKKDHSAFIKIVDFGIGIPKEMQAHVFEQFSKAGRQGLMGEKSIGLGLHISHKIIEQHNGELYVNSTENEGTTFTIQLPA
ncbi:HAMP domain-containing sensor histidine kinase [uncultured Pedobacter sp.]|uniref:sensor histidine kinase n=2 Tax=Pedobacter TaxID=84567 RepID=UPI00261FB228|nr:HAMP domain-containing sensor histidine kinase [uncultured Pedobacter sp.]